MIKKVGPGANTPIHGRKESPKNPEDVALAKAVLAAKPEGKDFSAKAGGSHPLTQAIAKAILGA